MEARFFLIRFIQIILFTINAGKIPRLDRDALKIHQDDRIMMITSAGCNVLDHALLGPKEICAVDMNPRQNALLELKIAGIRKLDYETFFSLFGTGVNTQINEIYHDVLRQELSPTAQEFWDDHLNYFMPQKQLYFSGTAGTLAKGMNTYIDLMGLREPIERMFQCKTVQEQREFYYSEIQEIFWNRFIRWIFKWDATLSLVAVPRAQRKLIDHYSGGMSKFIENCVEGVFTRVPLFDNYFWWLYITGSYTKTRCPEYLKEENFNQLKKGTELDRITIVTSTITDFLKNTEKWISKYILLDHMDWLSQRNIKLLQEEWEWIFNKASDSARVIWRSAGNSVNFIDPLFVSSKGREFQIGNQLDYKRDLAAQLHSKDRVHTYGSFYIADLIQPATSH